MLNINASGYWIYEISFWREVKAFLESYDKIIACTIGINESIKNMGATTLWHDNGTEFLKTITLKEITHREYESFVNFMPTYFGEVAIFERIEDLMSEV